MGSNDVDGSPRLDGAPVSFLGYDRGRLATVRRRLDAIANEAAGLTFSDAHAADAATLYRSAVALMTAWRADLDAIASCSFGSAYQPIALDAADPAWLDLLRPGDAAWATVTDPRSGVVVSAEDHARHLAEYLAALELGDGRRLDEILAVLTAVTANAATRDIFLTTLGADRFGFVAEALAGQVASSGAPSDAGRLLAGLAAGFGSSYRAATIDRSAWEAVLADGIDPYATALVLQSAGLAGADLGRLAGTAWHRWNERRYDGMDETSAAAKQTPAILLGVLTPDPIAARCALERFNDEDLALLFGTDYAPAGSALPFLLASADPRSGAPEEMRASMVAVLTFLRDHQDLARSSLVTSGLGDYVGPYLEQLIGASDESSYPVEPWQLEPDLVGWIALDETSAQTLEAYSAALVITRVAELAAANTFREPLLDHLGGLAGTVDRMVADANVLKAEQRNAAWRDGWSAISGLIPVPGASALANVIGGRIKSAGIGLWRGVWQDNGWLLAPPPTAGVAAAEHDRIDEREDRRQADELAAFFAAGRATGALPPGAEPPPYVPGTDYVATRNAWVDEPGLGPDVAAARQTLWHAAEAYDAGVHRALSA